MKTPFEATLELLTESENEAATELLVVGLETRVRAVAEGCLRALLHRSAPKAHLELLKNWHGFSDRWKSIIAERAGSFTPAIREALQSRKLEWMRNACEAAVRNRDYDSATVLLAAAERPGEQRAPASEAILRLADALYEELQEPRDYAVKRDPQLIRANLLGPLEASAGRFSEHGNVAVLEAFAVLASRENATLNYLMYDSADSAREPLCERLLHSTRPGVMRLLLQYLGDPRAPLAALQLIASRSDVGFFRKLCRRLADDACPTIDANLARLEAIPWTRENIDLVDSISEKEFAGAVRLLVKSKLEPKLVRRTLLRMLKSASDAGRRAIIAGLAGFADSEVDRLFDQWLDDPIAIVQAEAVRHARSRRLPDILPRIVEKLGSPLAEVREAAQEALAEFRFERYLAAFEALSPEIRHSTGLMVKRVNPGLADDLATELAAGSRARKLRVLAMIDVLEMIVPLEFDLAVLANEVDRAVREEAHRLLCKIRSDRAASFGLETLQPLEARDESLRPAELSTLTHELTDWHEDYNDETSQRFTEQQA